MLKKKKKVNIINLFCIEGLTERLDWIEYKQNTILRRIFKMARTLDEVLAKVAEQDTRLDSVRQLIIGLRQQLKDALENANLSPANQAKVDAIFDQAEKNSAEIEEAITENTESEPNP